MQNRHEIAPPKIKGNSLKITLKNTPVKSRKEGRLYK